MALLEQNGSGNVCDADALVEAATHSVQSLERLCYLTSAAVQKPQEPSQHVSECHRILDSLRTLKSELEGSGYKCGSPASLSLSLLSQLKHLVLAHTPASMAEQHKVKIAELLAEMMAGQVKTLLYACILTCPWYSTAQQHLSSKANRNILFVVYVALDETFFSLATAHERGLLDTMDHGFLFACEVRHFCSEILGGNVRSIEALSAPPEAMLICSPPWLQLVGLLQQPQALLSKSFVASCMGQALGAVASRTKGKEDSLLLKPGVDLTTFSTTCRLLYYAECALKGDNLCCWTSSDDFPDTANEHANTAVLLLRDGFSGLERKTQLLECVLAWKLKLSELPAPSTPDDCMWTAELGQWLASVRLSGLTLRPSSPLPDHDHQRVSELLCSLKLQRIAASDVLMVCLAGSSLYNLALPTSDKDYIVLFRQPTGHLVSSIKQPSESQHSRGQQLPQEAGAYEARMLCDMILKGAVNMIELLFAREWFYCSDQWLELVAHRDQFISEQVILQYVGYIKTHLSRLNKPGKHSDEHRQRKAFYCIFHKLLSLDEFVVGKFPIVRVSGETRDFIMRIRTGPLEGVFSSEELYQLAQHRLSEARKRLRVRSSRLREYGDYHFLQSWLQSSVRGIHFHKS